MSLTSVRKDPEALTMTIVAEYDAGLEQVWQMWADPRKLERWWGPPTYPATVVEHDLSPGGRTTYFMTGPEGERYGGWWQVLTVDVPHLLEFQDGFADAEGEPDLAMPVTTTRVTVEPPPGGGTRMTIESLFPSAEAMRQMLEMGVEEGFVAALGQIDGILAEAAPSP